MARHQPRRTGVPTSFEHKLDTVEISIASIALALGYTAVILAIIGVSTDVGSGNRKSGDSVA